MAAHLHVRSRGVLWLSSCRMRGMRRSSGQTSASLQVVGSCQGPRRQDDAEHKEPRGFCNENKMNKKLAMWHANRGSSSCSLFVTTATPALAASPCGIFVIGLLDVGHPIGHPGLG